MAKNIFFALSVTTIILITQVIQKLYPLIDNHFLGYLGPQVLLIHNVYYIFQYIAQYTGIAAATTCMILWKSHNNENRSTILYSFGLLTLFSTAILVVPIFYLLPTIINHFHIASEYVSLAKTYLSFGLVITIVLSIFYLLIVNDGGTGFHKRALFFSVIMLLIIVIVNFVGIKEVTHDESVKFIIVSKMIMFSVLGVVMVGLIFFSKKIDFRALTRIGNIGYKIWFSELSSGLITALYPIIFAFQLALADKNNNLIITYQLSLALTALLCAPLMCAMQANLAHASGCNGQLKNQTWWKNILYFGLFPTLLLLMISVVFNKSLIHLIFNYNVPASHEDYIILFFVATMIGQVGNALTTILRARKKSHIVTVIYYISDIAFLLGVTQILIFSHYINPLTVGIATMIYTVSYTGMCLFFCLKWR